MRKLVVVLAGLAVLTGCSNTDPTQKHDYACTTAPFGGVTGACVQLRITEVEGNVAEAACHDKGGTWTYHACDATGQVPGYCQVDSASDYSLSGTPAKVYFYDPQTPTTAETACNTGGGTWF